MIGTLYQIRAQYVAETQAAEARVNSFAAANDRASGKVSALRSTISSLGGAIMAAFGGAATIGIGLLTKKIVELNRESSDAQISVASVFSLNGLGTFQQGMSRAKTLMADFKKAAITSPGESRDLQNIFNRTAPTLARFNPSNKEITTFASRGLAAAFTLMGGDVDLTGDQLSQMMMGQAGADNKLFQSIRSPLMENLGIKEKDPAKAVEQFNKLTAKDPRKVFDGIMKTLQSLDAANEAFANSLTGRLGSLGELSSNFLSSLGGPLMERANNFLGQMLRWADSAQGSVDSLAKTVGDKLAGAFDAAQRYALMLYQNAKLIVAVMGAAAFRGGIAALAQTAPMIGVGGARGYITRGSGIARGVGAGASTVVRSAAGAVRAAPGAALSFLGDMLFGNVAAAATGGPAASSLGARLARAPGAARAAVAGGARAVPGALRAAGSFLASDPALLLRSIEARRVAGGGFMAMGRSALAGPAGAALAGVKGLAGALGTLGTTLVPLVIVVGMIAGVFRVLKDESNDATAFLRTSWGELRIVLDTIANQFGAGGGFSGAVKSFADWLGTGVVGVFGLAVKAIEQVLQGFSWLIVMLKGIGLALGTLSDVYAKRGLSGLTGDTIAGAFNSGFATAEEERRKAERSAYEAEAQRRRDAAKLESDQAYTRIAEERLAKASEEAREQELKDLADKGAPKIEVKNNIQVITEADPDKIAIRLDQMSAASVTNAIRSIEGLPGF